MGTVLPMRDEPLVDDSPVAPSLLDDSPIPAPGQEIALEHQRHRAPTPGRQKGTENRLTKERRAFVEMVIGAEDSEERALFAAQIRKQFMEGTIAPAIATLILQWWLGKPKEHVSIDARVQKVIRTIVDPAAPDSVVVEGSVVTRD